MATQGGGAAYQRLQPLQDSLNQGLQYWGAQIGQRAGEERARKDAQDAARAKAKEDWETKWGLSSEDFINQYTGFTSYDEFAKDGANYMRDAYVQASREGSQALESGDLEARRNAELKMSKIKNNFNNFKAGQESFAKLFQDYQKLDSEGKISGVDSQVWDGMFQSALVDNNVRFRMDDNLNPVAVGMYTNDEGKQVPFELPMSGLINGTIRPIERIELDGKDGYIQEILVNLGKNTVDTRTGIVTVTDQQFDDIRQNATNATLDSFLTDERKVADVLNQMDGSKKRSGFTEDEIAKAKEFLYKKVEAGYSTKREESVKYPPSSGGASAEERKASIRKRDIQDVIENRNLGLFTGDIKWGGKNLTIEDANFVGDDLVIRAIDPKARGKKALQIIKVSANEPTGINDVFNAMQGKGYLSHDVVQTTPIADPYRETPSQAEVSVLQLLKGAYDSQGKFIGEETKIKSQLEKYYPYAVIEEDVAFVDALKVNGKTISLKQDSKIVNSELMQALGQGSQPASQASTPDGGFDPNDPI